MHKAMMETEIEGKVKWVEKPVPYKLSEQINLLKSIIDKPVVIELETMSQIPAYICGTQKLVDKMKANKKDSIVMDAMSAHMLVEYAPMLLIDILRVFVTEEDVKTYFRTTLGPKMDEANEQTVDKWW